MDKINITVVFCMLMFWNMFLLGVGGYFVVICHEYWVVFIILILGVDPYNFNVTTDDGKDEKEIIK